MRFCLSFAILTAMIASSLLAGEPATGLIVPKGFSAEKFAGDDLAHDIYTITAAADGRIVVSGPGYIKRLIDQDKDGTADRAELLSEFPKGGAHGLCEHPAGLLVNGDDHLSLLSDRDGDGRYETRETWAGLKSTEHGGNNIVRGPDDWYYVACGNDAGVTAAFSKTKNSPITNPTAGAILRFSPDGKRSEIVADGFRNPYGLAFSDDGILWTYDSDNERDQFLPWYCPTHIFQVHPGKHHGWVNGGWQNGWNRPEIWPEVVKRHRELGRGSPTGVVCYQGTRWPAAYRDKVLAACWSRGRVYRIERDPAKIADPHAPVRDDELFVKPAPGAALAIVGMAFGRNDDLYVAVGGRKTQGTVYRISYVGDAGSAPRQSVANNLAMPIDRDDPAMKAVSEQLAKVRELQKRYGEIPNHKFLPEVFQGYSAAENENPKHPDLSPLRDEVHRFTETDVLTLASSHPLRELDKERARLFAIAAIDEPMLTAKLLDRISAKTSVENDLHYLISFAKLPISREPSETERTASALLGLHTKLRSIEGIPSRNWPIRVGELFQALVSHDPGLPNAIAIHERFKLPEQTLFIQNSPRDMRETMTRALVGRLVTADEDEWTPELLASLKYLPRTEAVGYLRSQWEETALRDAATLELASAPEPADREKFLAALSGFDAAVVRASLSALSKTTAKNHVGTPQELAALLATIRGLASSPNAKGIRDDAAALFAAWSGLAELPPELPKGKPLEHYKEYFAWMRDKYPQEASQLDANGADAETWAKRLSSIPFETGDVGRGKRVFETLQCARCHAGAGHLGPDLKGASSRLTRADLLTAVVDPNRDVAPTFQTKAITTPDGKTTIGIVIYESPETTMVVVGPDSTAQLQGVTPAMIRPNRNSLMPTGLLNRATEQDVADLFRYLQELK